MWIKIYRRNAVIRNQMIFIVLSMAYLQVVNSLSQGSSALDLDSFWTLIKKYQIIACLGIVALYLTYKVRRSAKIFLLPYVASITFISIYAFIKDFDKAILLLNFLYILSAYYFHLLFSLELEQAIYRPGFVHNIIGSRCEYNLPVKIVSPKAKTQGKLSNWDEQSCFVAINKDKPLPRGKVHLTLTWEGSEFAADGTVDTCADHGVGVRFKKGKKKRILGWPEFYDIMEDRGYHLRFT